LNNTSKNSFSTPRSENYIHFEKKNYILSNKLFNPMYRETNQVIDLSSKFGLALGNDSRIFSFCPSFILNVVMVNVIFVGFARGF